MKILLTACLVFGALLTGAPLAPLALDMPMSCETAAEGSCCSLPEEGSGPAKCPVTDAAGCECCLSAHVLFADKFPPSFHVELVVVFEVSTMLSPALVVIEPQAPPPKLTVV